jgi:outer membrane protein assembly factor BamA
MSGKIRVSVLAAVLTIGAASPPVYILNGYSFGGFAGNDTDQLAAKLKDREGARVTDKDIAADEAALEKELAARHIEGRLFTTTAEKHGRVWVIFDLQKPREPPAPWEASNHHLGAQAFEGATAISTSALAAATGLKPGDALSQDRINAARQAIVNAYAMALPGRTPSIKGRMQIKGDGGVVLTWIIGEPK